MIDLAPLDYKKGEKVGGRQPHSLSLGTLLPCLLIQKYYIMGLKAMPENSPLSNWLKFSVKRNANFS